ncbi:MAG: hypothetical protein JEZ02_19865 [Desulfatibacillum sp.]|nr:hypothetical protein [Desulfatibacillum sp.]
MSNRTSHLTEDLILMSIVDYEDLNQENQEHLFQCSTCGTQRETLLNSLEGLGNTARNLCPPAPRPLNWDYAPRPRWWSVFSLPRPVYALAGALASILIALVLLHNPQAPMEIIPFKPTEVSVVYTIALDEVMVDIEESTLTPALMDLAGEAYMEWDQDFFDFLSPGFETELLTFGARLKGALA